MFSELRKISQRFVNISSTLVHREKALLAPQAPSVRARAHAGSHASAALDLHMANGGTVDPVLRSRYNIMHSRRYILQALACR